MIIETYFWRISDDGPHIQAIDPETNVSLNYPYAFDWPEGHRAAADAFADLIGWERTYSSGIYLLGDHQEHTLERRTDA